MVVLLLFTDIFNMYVVCTNLITCTMYIYKISHLLKAQWPTETKPSQTNSIQSESPKGKSFQHNCIDVMNA